MDLKTAIRKASNSNVSPTAFYALLSDFGAFEEEKPWVKSITKTICDKNYHQQLLKLTLPDKSNSLRIQDIIYKLSSQYGYEAGKGLSITGPSCEAQPGFSSPNHFLRYPHERNDGKRQLPFSKGFLNHSKQRPGERNGFHAARTSQQEPIKNNTYEKKKHYDAKRGH